MAMAIGSVAVGSASEVRAAAPIVQGQLVAINNQIQIIFSAWLGTPLPTASQFELKVDGATVPVTSLTPVGSILQVNFAPNVEADTLPDKCFLLPSRVVISIIEDVLPPYSAPKPALYTSALLIMSLSNTENKPIE